MRGAKPFLRGVSVIVLTTFGSLVAHAAPAPEQTPPPPPVERTPVAVLWMGDFDPEVAPRIADEVNAALARKQTVRPIDSGEDRKVLIEGGPTSRAIQSMHDAEALLARGKIADAAVALEAAEARLLTDVPSTRWSTSSPRSSAACSPRTTSSARPPRRAARRCACAWRPARLTT